MGCWVTDGYGEWKDGREARSMIERENDQKEKEREGCMDGQMGKKNIYQNFLYFFTAFTFLHFSGSAFLCIALHSIGWMKNDERRGLMGKMSKNLFFFSFFFSKKL